MKRALLALAVGLWGLLGVPLSAWAARTVSVAVISAADDPRYASRRMEQGYPGQPQGRAVEGMQLAAKDAEFELGESELALSVKDVVLPTAADLPMALAELKKAEVHYLVADLPEPALRELVRTAPAVLGDVIVFNTGLAEDSLRAEACSAVLLHTFPSRQMEMDAIVQYLAARNWRKVLMLQGPRPGDALMQQAFGRSAKRYGLKIVQTKPFKLSGDPRERDLVALCRLRPARERQPLHADVLLRDRPVIGDVVAQLLKKRRVGVGADGDRPVRVLIDLNGVADDVLLVFYIVLIGRNRLRVQRLTSGRGIAGLIPLPAARQGQNQRQRRTGEQTQLYHFHRHHLQRQSTGNL